MSGKYIFYGPNHCQRITKDEIMNKKLNNKEISVRTSEDNNSKADKTITTAEYCVLSSIA